MHSGQRAERRPMHQVVAGLRTKSDKIRALAHEGYSRSEIAKYLEIRYQHVRNVLIQSPPAKAQQQAGDQAKTTIGPGGRVVIPAAYRQALGLEEGDDVVMTLEGDTLRLESRRARLRRAQERVASHLEGAQFASHAFVAERRREAKREEADG